MYIVKIPLFNDDVGDDGSASLSDSDTLDFPLGAPTAAAASYAPFSAARVVQPRKTTTAAAAETSSQRACRMRKYKFCWNNTDLTYVSCWNCAFELLASECVGIPTTIHDSKFVCYGYFCSFECAARYLYDTLFVQKPDEYYNQYSLLCTVRQILLAGTDGDSDSGAAAASIPPIRMAPPRMVLEKFGGSVTYDEYRRRPGCIDFYRLPLVPLDVYIMNMSS